MPTGATGRELTIGGAFNVRDIGGLRTRGGAFVRRGLVYRSGDLGRLTAAGAEDLRAAGVLTVVDLRRDPEIEQHGRYPFERHGIAYRHRPLLDWSSTGGQEQPAELPPDILDLAYRRMADEGGTNVGLVLTWMSEADTLPALVHCVAGKDRTGLVIAMLLALLDVPDDEIVADYALSAAALAAHRVWADANDAPAAAWMTLVPPVLMRSDPEAMRSFLAWLRERHGSVEGYAGSIGVGSETVAALRARLLSDPG
jgi:protein-tyrosine phosphatase